MSGAPGTYWLQRLAGDWPLSAARRVGVDLLRPSSLHAHIPATKLLPVLSRGPFVAFWFDSEESFWSGRNACLVLWRLEALDCRVLKYPSRSLEWTYT